jgi:aspartyl protease family protein
MVETMLLSPRTGERLVFEALVDTGATFTTLPKIVAEKLDLVEVTRRRVRTASGEEVLPESYVTIEIRGERTTTPVLISEKIDRVLLGVLTLEALALKVDPKTGQLEKTELLLLVAC